MREILSILSVSTYVVLIASVFLKIYSYIFIEKSKTNLFSFSINDSIVIAIEIGLAILYLFIPFKAGCILLSIYYAGLIFVALNLKGTKCNCFGASNNIIGAKHIIFLTLFVFINSISALWAAPIIHIISYMYSLVLGLGLLYLWIGNNNKKYSYYTKNAENKDISIENIYQINIITQETCNACNALKNIIKDMKFTVDLNILDESTSEISKKYRVASFPTAIIVENDGSSIVTSGISEIVSYLSLLKKTS